MSQWDNEKSRKVEEEEKEQLQQQCLSKLPACKSKLLPHKSLSKCNINISLACCSLGWMISNLYHFPSANPICMPKSEVK